MTKQYVVELIDDTGLDLRCDVEINGKKCDKAINQTAMVWYCDEDDAVELSIMKEDQWAKTRPLNNLLMLLFSLARY